MCSKLDISSLFQTSDYPKDAFNLEKTFSGRPIILYGAGESSIWFFEIITNIFGYPPSLVLDNRFSEETEYEGIRARTPLGYKPTSELKSSAVVVVCCGKKTLQREMHESVKELGFQNIIFLRDIYEIHNPFSQPEQLFEQGFEYYLNHKQDVFSAYDLFDDDESRAVFHSFLQTHMERKPVSIPDRPSSEQYFPSDIELNKGYKRFISCGAYDGDTVRLLNTLHGKVDEIICLEAEPSIYTRLSDYLNKHSDNLANKIVALPCAAYSHEAVMKFTSSTGLGSRLSETGDCMVQSVALDHVFPDFSPSFISMDIEGAEPYALKGAENMIRKHKPDLGVCLYHSPNHLWEVPLYLNSLDLGYRFYLRNYTSFSIETVLYATL